VSFKSRRAKRLKRRNQRKRGAAEARIVNLLNGRTGTIESVKRGEQVVWRVRWRDRKGRSRARVVHSKRKAEVIAATVARGGQS
jgi:hypothetical protein